MQNLALITGGTKGLGRAMVRKWLAEGWRVATCARNEAEIANLESEQASDDLMAEALDISDITHVRGFVARLIERWGVPDVLINNASILGVRQEIAEYPDETWRRVMEINVNGSFYMTQAVLPHMIARRNGGVIVNISSGAGIVGSKRWGAYSASKFALEGMTQVLRAEVIDHGIRVHAIDPGAMRTEMRAAAYPAEDPHQHPTPEAIARVVFDIAAVYEPQLARLVAKEYL